MMIDFRIVRRGEPLRGERGLISQNVHLVSHPRISFMVSHCFLEVVKTQDK